MKKLVSVILSCVMVFSVCSVAFSEVSTSPLDGIWMREFDESRTDIFFIRGSYLKRVLGTDEYSYVSLLGDASRPNVFYLVSDSASVYELTLSEDGNSLMFRYVGTDTTNAWIYTRLK